MFIFPRDHRLKSVKIITKIIVRIRKEMKAYREDEAITSLEDSTEELSSSPHHVQIFWGHKEGVATIISSITFCLHLITMWMQLQATIISFMVPSYQNQVIQQLLRVVSDPKTLQKQVKYRTWFDPRVV